MADKTNPEEAPLYVSIQRAAQLCEVSQDTIRRLIARGDLEAVRFSRQLIRIPVASLAAYGQPIGGRATTTEKNDN